MVLLVTPCWKVQSGLICNQSHPGGGASWHLDDFGWIAGQIALSNTCSFILRKITNTSHIFFNDFGCWNEAGGKLVIIDSAVRYWIYKVWTAPGLIPIDQSAYRITAEQVIIMYTQFRLVSWKLLIFENTNFFSSTRIIPYCTCAFSGHFTCTFLPY